MAQPKQELFRKKSLERLSSPEKLEQLMQVVNPRDWIAIASLGALLTGALTWSIFGRIPIAIQGQGAMVYPHQIVPLQSTSTGQLVSLEVEIGDVVKKGDVIGIIDQSETRKQLTLEQLRLKGLQAQDKAMRSLQTRGVDQAKKTTQQQRQYLQERLQAAQALDPVLQERQRVRMDLFDKERAISSDNALEAKQQYLENLSTMGDLQAQLEELNNREIDLDRQNLQDSAAREKEIQQATHNIAQLELQLQNNSRVIAPSAGRILEFTVTPGTVLQPGIRLANISTEVSSSDLVGVTFFSVKDGKQIKPGMTIQITPQTVERERFGGIIGTVTSVSAFPITREAAANMVGNKEIVEDLVPNENSLIAVSAKLEPNAGTFSGYRWSSSQGPNLKVSSGTTTVSNVTTEERAPITFILPIIKEWTGIQ